MPDAINKLEPYTGALLEVANRSRKISRLRGELSQEITGRREALLRAREAGCPREKLAGAAGVSEVRVSQIMAGGAK